METIPEKSGQVWIEQVDALMSLLRLRRRSSA